MIQGITKAEYSDAGAGSYTEIAGLTDQSKVAYEYPEDEKDPQGTPYFAGERQKPEVHFVDAASYTDLIAKYRTDTRVDLRLTLEDDSTIVVADVLPFVKKGERKGATGGRMTYMLTPSGFTSNPAA